MEGRVIILSAPSGSGKSTIMRFLLSQCPSLQFSISATNRPPRGEEQHGVDYFFISPEEFQAKIEAGEFLEYEEVYSGRFYGTLKSEVERIRQEGGNVIFDIDVVGGCNLKEIYGDEALSIFICPPDMNTLRQRLINRGTDSAEVIEDRLNKAEWEMGFRPRFDVCIINDDLEEAQKQTLKTVLKVMNQ
jgi:guanylate kinase